MLWYPCEPPFKSLGYPSFRHFLTSLLRFTIPFPKGGFRSFPRGVNYSKESREGFGMDAKLATHAADSAGRRGTVDAAISAAATESVDVNELECKRVVVALGGNALGKTSAEQQAKLDIAAGHLTDLIHEGINLVIVHGNGPQVGLIERAFTFAHRNTRSLEPLMPLSDCNAMSQGYIGGQLTRALMNAFAAQGVKRPVCDVPTHMVVDANDPAFNVYDKPIGVFMTEQEAREFAKTTGYKVAPDSGRGWRRMVPSPEPKDIIELGVIRQLVDSGCVTVAAGGGGMPLISRDGKYEPAEVVLDKDYASAILAIKLEADMLILLTEVDCVYINFNQPNQQALRTMTAQQARTYCEQGQFAPGSMLPKVEACIQYVEAHPGGRALITSLGHALDGLRGEMGTLITND